MLQDLRYQKIKRNREEMNGIGECAYNRFYKLSKVYGLSILYCQLFYNSNQERMTIIMCT